jgi:hypothetical protein
MVAALAWPLAAVAIPIQGPDGHHYELIETSSTWEDARTAALGSTYLGEQGYLATVSSAAENLFISGLLNGSNAWLGGNDVLVGDVWEWADGPEAGVDFWLGLQGGSPVGGAFTNWGSNDPNNSGGNQYALLMCATGVSPCINEALGEWIDRPGSDLHYYVVEYATTPEPAPGLLLGLGIVAMGAQRRWRAPRFH